MDKGYFIKYVQKRKEIWLYNDMKIVCREALFADGILC